MKLKQLLAGILLLAFFAATAAACRYRQPQPEPETEPAVTAPAETALPPETTLPPETESAAVFEGLVEDDSYRPAAMDKTAVLRLYTDAVNDVKLRCPGFTKKETQDVSNVTAGRGRLELANRILSLVAAELVNSTGGGSETVPPHADVRVREAFPIYGKDSGCRLSDMSLLKSAVCYTDGATYKLVITLKEAVNPDPETSEFAKIMTPLERRNVAGGVAQYLTLLDLDRYVFDFTYTDSEITAVIDRETGRLTELTHRTVVLVDVDLDLDLFWLSANLIEAHGTVVHKVEFTDFDFSA